MSPQRFRKKPVVVEAMHWDGTPEGATPIIDWVLANGPDDGPVARYSEYRLAKADGDPPSVERTGPTIAIVTLEGTMHASPGDWVIREPFPTDDRLFYPCKPGIFDATYEPVEDSPAAVLDMDGDRWNRLADGRYSYGELVKSYEALALAHGPLEPVE